MTCEGWQLAEVSEHGLEGKVSSLYHDPKYSTIYLPMRGGEIE